MVKLFPVRYLCPVSKRLILHTNQLAQEANQQPETRLTTNYKEFLPEIIHILPEIIHSEKFSS